MNSPFPFAQVDVFSAEPLLGNPVAVVLGADGLSAEQMQRFTAWTNLSEATFVTRAADPAADYAVRIFTGDRELPFAGHPTLGTAHAWLAAGGRPHRETIVQECGAGLISIRHEGASGRLSFAAPPRNRSGPLADADLDAISRAVGIARDDVVDHQWCDNGPPWQAVLLRDAAQALALRPDPVALAGRYVGVVAPHPEGSDVDFELRAFFPTAHGTGEDPVTGSLNGAVGQWLTGNGRAPTRYTAAQGTALGFAGRVGIEAVDGVVWVGGHCTTVLEGTASL